MRLCVRPEAMWRCHLENSSRLASSNEANASCGDMQKRPWDDAIHISQQVPLSRDPTCNRPNAAVRLIKLLKFVRRVQRLCHWTQHRQPSGVLRNASVIVPKQCHGSDTVVPDSRIVLISTTCFLFACSLLVCFVTHSHVPLLSNGFVPSRGLAKLRLWPRDVSGRLRPWQPDFRFA